MNRIVLLQKVYGEVSLSMFEGVLKGICEGLSVEFMNLGLVGNGWVEVEVSGEDERAAIRFLEKKLGLAPVTVAEVKRFSIIRGRIASLRKSRTEIFVDIGVFSPEFAYAMVPLQRLQGQLVDGEKVVLQQIVELFGLVAGFPLGVRITDVDGLFEAELDEEQLELYGRWVASRLDRLVILGALEEMVWKAVERARLERDVVEVEALSVSEHAVVCKLGTDAVGLVSKLGKMLPRARFVCFSPRKVLGWVGERWSGHVC